MLSIACGLVVEMHAKQTYFSSGNCTDNKVFLKYPNLAMFSQVAAHC